MTFSGRVKSEWFVGREKELEIFQQFLQSDSPAKVLSMYSHGEGGIGKTQVLLRMQEYCASCAEEVHFPRELIDFYHAESRSKIGVMQQIVQGLNAEFFPCFRSVITQYHATNDVSEREELLLQIEESFRQDFAGFSERLAQEAVIVLFFDTYEVIQGTGFSSGPQGRMELAGFSLWVETQLFPMLCHENTRIVVSGRYPLQQLDKQQFSVKEFDLNNFDLDETQEFWRRCFQLPTNTELRELIGSETLVRTFHELADGRPILLALFADWVSYEQNPWLPEDLLEEIERKMTPNLVRVQKERKLLFERALIERITSLEHLEDLAISYMAIAYHRMTPELFHAIADIPLEESRRVLMETLRPLSFIKYKKEEFVLLHDEMRDLVRRHYWETADPLGEIRKGIAEKLVSYYHEILLQQDAGQEEREIYNSELLEYALIVHPKEGLQHFYREFDLALEDGRYDYCDLLLREVQHYYARHADELPFPEFLEIDLRQIHFQTTTTGSYGAAIEKAEQILERYEDAPDWDRLKGRFFMAKGLAELWAGQFQEAIDSFNTAKDLFYYFGDDARLYRADNRIGYAWYRQGIFKQSEEQLQKSLAGFVRLLRQQSDGGEDEVRRQRRLLQGIQYALGNLSMVFRYTGKFDSSVRNAEMLLNIVWHLPRNKKEIVRARITVGTTLALAGRSIEAQYNSEVASELLEDIHDRLLMGRVKVNQAWLQYRKREIAPLLEFYRAEDIAGVIESLHQNLEQAEDIERARGFLEDAIQILSAEPPIKKELADAYFALGELYMVSPAQDHWERAEDALRQSVALSSQCKFSYTEVDSLESLVTLYYFWNGDKAIPATVKERNLEKMRECKARLEHFEAGAFPNLFGRYEVTLGDIEFDAALQLLQQEEEENNQAVEKHLKEAFTHYIRAILLMSEYNKERHYLVLRVFYNRLTTLIEHTEYTYELARWLQQLEPLWQNQGRILERCEKIYKYVQLYIQHRSRGRSSKKFEDLENHLRKVLDKGNYGWALLLNDCLIGAYKKALLADDANERSCERLIEQLNAQAIYYTVFGDAYHAMEYNAEARRYLTKLADSHAQEALEAFTDSFEGAIHYRRGEYGKLLEFYLHDELDIARERFDRQFPGSREEAFRLLQQGERQLQHVISRCEEEWQQGRQTEEASAMKERLSCYRGYLADNKFRTGELQMLNGMFEDRPEGKGAFSYLTEAMQEAERIGYAFLYDDAVQSLANAYYFSGNPVYEDERVELEKILDRKLRNGETVFHSIMGKLRITQGDALFSACFTRKPEILEREKRPTPDRTREIKADTPTLRMMLRYYVEACDFMAQHSPIYFALAVRVLQQRIGAIPDKQALQIIQNGLTDIWLDREHLKTEKDELQALIQFAEIRSLIANDENNEKTI